MGRADLAGFVLAGGRSSRMGRDKALLEFRGRPLIAGAVNGLRQMCGEVFVLGDRQDLAAYADVIADRHANVGPMGGIEAALACSAMRWNLFVPVDMPFLSGELLEKWVGTVTDGVRSSVRASMMSVDGEIQPMPCLLDRELGPLVSEAVAKGQYRLLAAVQECCEVLAREGGLAAVEVFQAMAVEELEPAASPGAARMWFTNVNTPEQFAGIEGGEG